MGAPDVVIKAAQVLAIPVDGIEVDVATSCADSLEERGEPADALRCRGDSRRATADALSTKRFDAAEPFFRGDVDGDVGLVWEFGLIECYNGISRCESRTNLL